MEPTPLPPVLVAEDPSAVIEEKELVRFERADEYLGLLSQLVPSASGSSSSDAAPVTQADAFDTLISILDEYQDQSNLLDPYLERIVSPPVEALQRHVHSLALVGDRGSCQRLDQPTVVRLSKLVYGYTKVRGYKTIVHYFPHEVGDLPATLSFLEALQRSEPGISDCWQLRYVCLLWLSLICIIPFDLVKFDRPDHQHGKSTAARIVAVAHHFISSPGKERDAAAVVLGRLFQRSDVQSSHHFQVFLSTCLHALRGAELTSFCATGILQSLCEILKTSEPAFVAMHLAAFQSVLDTYDSLSNAALANNALMIKYRTKLSSRLALKLLRPRARRRANNVLPLGASSDLVSAANQAPLVEEEDNDDDQDVPDQVESSISALLDSLQHKDTVVRYSAAKGLARLCDRLPTSLLTQVIQAIISLFHINIPDLYQGATDLSSVSEHTWQGTCMALAELSRRGLLFGDMLTEALPWILKALLFDVRRGAHSVGANVRDAACYVVWALARSNDTDSIRPHALELATRLVAVATLDRDVSIRRAASAAFQESVGRLALFPHGIDVIRMTDFYAVSVRRTAFLACAVKVAQFQEYRGYLLDHLVEVVTLHWDPAMRMLGAQAAALITMHDATRLMPDLVSRLGKRITTADVAVLHGTLLTLAKVARISHTLPVCYAGTGDEAREQAFALLQSIRPAMLRSLGAAALLSAACSLVSTSFPPSLAVSQGETSAWEKILNLALARQEESVHTAAAEAVSQLSSTVDLSSKIHSILDGWHTLTLAQQQSNTLVLGAVDYANHKDLLANVVAHLVALGRPRTKTDVNALYSENVEVRRNAVESLTRAIVSLDHRLVGVCTPEIVRQVLAAYMLGLDDYSMDQRGDVGSWVRLASIGGLRKLLILLSKAAGGVGAWMSDGDLQSAVGGMWKQASERIDHVRHTAGCSVLAVYGAYRGIDSDIKPAGYQVVEATYGIESLRPFEVDDAEAIRVFKDPKQAYSSLAKVLTVPTFRLPVLQGLILAVGSKSDLGERIIAPALANLSCSSDSTDYNLVELLTDMFELAKRAFGDNRLLVPSLTLVNLLLENGVYHRDMFALLIRFAKMATTNVAKINSLARLTASATLAANLILPISTCRQHDATTATAGTLKQLITPSIELFLTHPLPAVRAAMAEHLYTVIASSLEFHHADDQTHKAWQQLEIVLLDTKWRDPTNIQLHSVESVKHALEILLA